MQRLKYTITTLSPVLLPVNTGDPNTVNTCTFINGSAILGAYAHRYIASKLTHLSKSDQACQDPTFCSWFLQGGLMFTNAYPVNPKTGQVHHISPFSIHKEKNDSLINGKPYIDLLFTDPKKLDVSTKSLDGYIRMEGERLETCSVNTSLNFHHARNPKTGTTEEGLIFNYESIDAGQTFEGNIIGEPDALNEFLQFAHATNENRLHLGRSKNAQYGGIEMKIASDQPEQFFSEVDALCLEEPDFDDDTLSLTLLSDLILYNEEGFSTTDVAYLEKLLGVKIGKTYLKTGYVENFVSVWGLPKPSEACFKAGSAFLVEACNDPKRLLKFQQEGIGERRHEGFGRIVLDWQTARNGLKKFPKGQNDLKRPALPVPTFARNMIEQTVKDVIVKKIKLAAITKANQFIHLPGRSQIGRLEAMAQASTQQELIKKLDKLRKTARDKLEACRTGSETLLDFLKTEHTDLKIEAIFKQKEYESLKKLADEIQFAPANDSEFLFKLYQDYLTTFFTIMRKRASTQKGGV